MGATSSPEQSLPKDDLPAGVAETLKNIQVSLLVAQDRLDVAQDYMEDLHNPHRTILKFKEGDLVMLSTGYHLDEVDRWCPKAKLLPRFTGPYKVLRVKDFDTYTLELPRTMSRQHPDFHVSLLKPYHANPPEFATRTPAPQPPVVEPDTQASSTRPMSY